MFSKLTRKQVIEAYDNKEYKKTIQILRSVFLNRNGFLKYLNGNDTDISSKDLKKLRDILYMWTVIDEFKKILSGDIDILTVAYMQEYEKEYVKAYFTDDEIKIIKEKSNSYFIQEKNKLLLRNYEEGNLEYVMNSLKCDYEGYFHFQSTVDLNSNFHYTRSEIAPLRELAHIYNHADYNVSNDNNIRYKYAMLKNLITIYKHMDIEYVERFLLRQKRIGIDIENCINDINILKLFSVEERTILTRIYKENIRNGLKVNKGVGLYNNSEYTRKLHILMNILELNGTNAEKYFAMKFNYKYKPCEIIESINSKYAMNGIRKQSLTLLKNLYNGYVKTYDDILIENKSDKSQKLGEELGRIITEFLDSNVDIDSYFNQNELLKKEYKRIQNYISKYCPEVYERFIDYRNIRIKNAALMVVNAIKNNEEFSELDYYSITNISYNEIKACLKELNYDDYILFNKFAVNNPKGKDLNKKGLDIMYESFYSFKVVDANGEEKTVSASLEDKKYVVTYLKYIKAPVTSKNITIALRRLLNNKLYTKENNLQKRITL